MMVAVSTNWFRKPGRLCYRFAKPVCADPQVLAVWRLGRARAELARIVRVCLRVLAGDTTGPVWLRRSGNAYSGMQADTYEPGIHVGGAGFDDALLGVSTLHADFLRCFLS